MRLPINKDGNIELDLSEIISEVVGKATDEERKTIIEYFGFLIPIRKLVIDMLAHEYSRPSFYEDVHKDRLELLTKVKQEELGYYAALIVDKVEDERRHNKAYWELYHWCSNNNITSRPSFPHQALKGGDWNWRLELEKVVTDIIKKERPDLLEVK